MSVFEWRTKTGLTDDETRISHCRCAAINRRRIHGGCLAVMDEAKNYTWPPQKKRGENLLLHFFAFHIYDRGTKFHPVWAASRSYREPPLIYYIILLSL